MLEVLPVAGRAVDGLFHARTIFWMNALKNCGVFDGGEPCRSQNILNVSSDQMISPLATRQPKLPVWLNRWASARYISLCRKAFSASLRSVTSSHAISTIN
jgi:hypothetical protein